MMAVNVAAVAEGIDEFKVVVPMDPGALDNRHVIIGDVPNRRATREEHEKCALRLSERGS